MQAAIIVKNLGKRYRSRDGGRPSSLKGRLLSGYRAPKAESFWGLRHLSFSIPRGRAVGVVGLNGAGKSTLLRLGGGVGVADEGSIRVNGRVGALLDIGAGLSEDLTGRENVFLLGVIAGLLRREIKERFDAIVTFAELQDFIDAPVRTYSTGMRMRLAFAVAVHTDPDVLLIDEVLAVGDLAFQRKCMRRVDRIRASGCTIFLVSHDDSQIRALCDDVLLLEGGRLIAYGPLEETMALYADTVDAKVAQAEAEQADEAPLRPLVMDSELTPEVNRFGSGEMVIEGVTITNLAGTPIAALTSGDGLEVRFRFRVPLIDDIPIAVLGIYAPDDTACFETNSQLGGIELRVDEGTGSVAIQIERLDLTPDDYRVTVGLFSSDWHKVYDYHAEVYPLRVDAPRPGPSKGYLNPPITWQAIDEFVPLPRDNGTA
jgi:lipopolysaccharide transport system ATP-binding protein